MTTHSQNANWKKAIFGSGLLLLFPLMITTTLATQAKADYSRCGSSIGACFVEHLISR